MIESFACWQQATAPKKTSLPKESLHAVRQLLHGSFEDNNLEALQSTAACLQMLSEAEDDCVVKTPVIIMITTAEIARTTEIIIRYSSAPWPLFIVRDRKNNYKRLTSRSRHIGNLCRDWNARRTACPASSRRKRASHGPAAVSGLVSFFQPASSG